MYPCLYKKILLLCYFMLQLVRKKEFYLNNNIKYFGKQIDKELRKMKHNYETMKAVNVVCGIIIGIILLASFVNNDSISAMFGLDAFDYGLNYGSITYFIGHNILWIIPLIILIRNLIIMKNLKGKE